MFRTIAPVDSTLSLEVKVLIVYLPHGTDWFYHVSGPLWASNYCLGMLLFGVDAKTDMLAHIPKGSAGLTVPQQSHSGHSPGAPLCSCANCWPRAFHTQLGALEVPPPEAISTQFCCSYSSTSCSLQKPSSELVGKRPSFWDNGKRRCMFKLCCLRVSLHKQLTSESWLKKTLSPAFQIVWDFCNFMIFGYLSSL